jgi:hypothetical protein
MVWNVVTQRKGKTIDLWSLMTGCDPSGRTVYGVGLRPLACRVCEFEFLRWHKYLSVVSVACFQRSLRRADHSSRGVLRKVVCRTVWSWSLDNEEAVAHQWFSRHGKKRQGAEEYLEVTTRKEQEGNMRFGMDQVWKLWRIHWVFGLTTPVKQAT